LAGRRMRWLCGCALRGGRLECRDHGLGGDYGGSRGRARAWSAGIRDQFMIMEHCAGDCWPPLGVLAWVLAATLGRPRAFAVDGAVDKSSFCG
jgi:hypothetical protein